MDARDVFLLGIILFILGLILGGMFQSSGWNDDITRCDKNKTLLICRGGYYKVEYVKEVK